MVTQNVEWHKEGCRRRHLQNNKDYLFFLDLCSLLGLLWHVINAKDESTDGELNKQIQIRGVDDAGSNQIGHVVTAFSWGVLSATVLVVVHRHNDKVSTHDHLTDLHDGDDPRRKPLGDGLTSLQEVVEIHDGMNSVVHGREVVTITGFSDVAVPSKNQHSNVMVPVQEDKRLLSQDNEHSVDEFWKLGQAKQHDSQTSSTHGVSSLSRFTDCFNKWTSVQQEKRVRNHSDGTPCTEHSQQQIPTSQRTKKVEWFAVLHDLSAEIAKEQVSNHSNDRNHIASLLHIIIDLLRIEILFKLGVKWFRLRHVVKELSVRLSSRMSSIVNPRMWCHC